MVQSTMHLLDNPWQTQVAGHGLKWAVQAMPESSTSLFLGCLAKSLSSSESQHAFSREPGALNACTQRALNVSSALEVYQKVFLERTLQMPNSSASSDDLPWRGVLCENDQVVWLELNNFSLSGTLPFSVSNLTTLQLLDVGSNIHLKGNIPQAVTCLSRLTSLSIQTTSVSGEIPESCILKRQSLEELSMQNSKISGTLLRHFPSTMKSLKLSALNISGTMPTGDHVDHALMSVLWLGDTNVSGSLPSDLVPKLLSFEMPGTKLSGVLSRHATGNLQVISSGTFWTILSWSLLNHSV